MESAAIAAPQDRRLRLPGSLHGVFVQTGDEGVEPRLNLVDTTDVSLRHLYGRDLTAFDEAAQPGHGKLSRVFCGTRLFECDGVLVG